MRKETMKRQRDWKLWNAIGAMGALLLLVRFHGAMVFGQAQKPAASAEQKSPVSPVGAKEAEEKAWNILRSGLKDANADKRMKAVRSLGMMGGSEEAEQAAKKATEDKKPNVRLAAVAALGAMKAGHAKVELEKALEESEPAIVLAAANALLLLHDSEGYDIYYGVLTGEQRGRKGLVKEQLDTLRDKKHMAKLGFEEGISFIPYAGMGYEAFKTVTKDDSSPVRATAARKLAKDPDRGTTKVLVAATKDKKWRVREAALQALSEREDAELVAQIAGAMDDEKEEVRFAAAACVAHLTSLQEREKSSGNKEASL
jgi:HEAT repeat protein